MELARARRRRALGDRVSPGRPVLRARWAPRSSRSSSVANDPPNLAMFLFSAVFMDTAATIPTGALAERWKFSAFVVYGFFISAVLYPLFANWVWGGGWLSALGTNFGLGHGEVDFAGSSVVHMTGGVTALAGAIVVGPRIGKYRKDGTISLMPGPQPAHGDDGDVRPRVRMVRLQRGLHARRVGVADRRDSGQHRHRLCHRRPHFALLRVAAPSAPGHRHGVQRDARRPGRRHRFLRVRCARCRRADRRRRGAARALRCRGARARAGRRPRRRHRRARRLRRCGGRSQWGSSPTAATATGSNGVPGPVQGALFGDFRQLAAQAIGAATNAVVVFGAAYVFFRILERLIGNRVDSEVEWQGLDSLEMGSDAYPRD